MVVPVFYADLTWMQAMDLELRTCTEGRSTLRDISGSMAISRSVPPAAYCGNLELCNTASLQKGGFHMAILSNSANPGAALMRRTFVRPRPEENNEWRMMIAAK
jgi:hypothetical protein